MIEYNLTTEKWIPYIDLKGKYCEAGLIDVLKKAHEIKSLSFENPLHEASVLLILITLAHRITAENIGSYSPKSINEKISIINNKKFNSVNICNYFRKWGNKFNLFDENYPFFQTSKLQTVDTKNHKITKDPLPICDLMQEKYKSFYNHNIEHIMLEPKKATWILLTAMYFRTGGLNRKKTNIFGYQESFNKTNFISGISLFYFGHTLFETISNNLLPNTPLPNNFEIGKPIWEDNEEDPKKYLPAGYLGYLTAKSRHINLIPEMIDDKIFVGKHYIAQGYLYDVSISNPFYIFKLNMKQEKVVIQLNPKKAIWRDSASFLIIDNSEKECKVLQMQRNVENRIMKKNFDIALFGFANDNANPIMIRKEVLTIPRAILYDIELQDKLSQAIEFSEDVAKSIYIANIQLTGQGKDNAENSGGKIDNNKIQATSIEYFYWAKLEPIFHTFIKDIAYDESLKNWKADVIKTAKSSIEEGSQGYNINARAKAELCFLGCIKKLEGTNAKTTK